MSALRTNRRRGGETQPQMMASRSLWPFLLPSGCLLALVMIYPLSYALWLSCFRYHLNSGAASFVGLANYVALLGEMRFWNALRRTFLIAGSAVGAEFCLWLLVAYGLYRLTFAVKTLNLLMFLPHIITPVVAALFLRWIFSGAGGCSTARWRGSECFPRTGSAMRIGRGRWWCWRTPGSSRRSSSWCCSRA
jgi:multiple sugar transport system permease protein